MDYRALIKEIKGKNIGSLYLFYGTEKYLLDKGIDKIKSAFLNDVNESFNYIFYEDFKGDMDELLESCETLPFMGERRIIIINNPEYFNGKKGGLNSNDEEKLLGYLNDIPDTTILIFMGDEKVDKRKKIFKQIKKIGNIVEFNKLTEKEFINLTKKRLSESNKQIDTKTLHRFIELSGYIGKDSNKTLYDVDNELNKLCNFISDRTTIAIEDIEKIMSKNIENNIFMLVDAVAEKRGGNALRILNQMLDSGEPEGRILYMIVRQFKLLNLTKILVNKGYTTISIAPKLKLPQYITKKYLNQVKYFAEEDLLNLLNQSLTAEKNIKTGNIKAKLAIEMLIIECCNV